jgi:pyridoxamine 5'-phosphate oxidase
VPPDSPSPASMRRDYTERGALLESDLAADWTTQFQDWFAAAIAYGLPEPNAMIVATATPDGHPSARTVLLKTIDERGFVFFTNYTSRKGTEALANPAVCLVFPWFGMQRQVIVNGTAEKVGRAETEAYFATRPRGSRLGAWASPQSQVVPGRAFLDERLADAEKELGEEIPPPPHWGGLRVRPETVEFWQGRSNRMHDRLRYRRDHDAWIVERLAP